jgi:hypothetical protein
MKNRNIWLPPRDPISVLPGCASKQSNRLSNEPSKKKKDLPISEWIVWPREGSLCLLFIDQHAARIQIAITAEHDDGGARRITPPR